MDENTPKNKTRNYSAEQIQYYFWLNEMKRIEGIPPESRTYEQTEELGNLKTKMWKGIVRYARGVMHQMMSGYTGSRTDYSDIEQGMAMIFFKNLHNYNPLKATPSTFFTPYFKQVISEYIRGYKKNLTQHDAANARKVNQVIHEYEKQNIRWTIDMVASKTKLSAKVVRNTLYYSRNSKTANIDDVEYLQSKIPTPEEALELKEMQNILSDAITRVATEEEAELLFRRINPDGQKEKPYDQIAKETGKSIKKVKNMINSLTCRLNQDDALRKRFGNQNRYNDFAPLKLQDESAKLEEEQLEIFLAEIS